MLRIRIAGSSSNSANWIGIVDLPDGQYRMEHGLVVTKDTIEAPPQEPAVALVAVNDFEQRLKDEKLRQQDRQRIEAELKAFRAQVCNGVTIRPVTYRNPQSQADEPGAEVFLEGTFEPLARISREHVPVVTSELSGVLVSGGPYTLKVLCPLDQGVRPARPLGVKNDPIPEVDNFPTRNNQGPSMEVVNGWQSRVNQGKATPGDLQCWKGKAGSRGIIRPTTFVRAGVSERAVALYRDGEGVQFGWIAREHIPAVK